MRDSESTDSGYDILQYYRQVSSDHDRLYKREDPILQQEIYTVGEVLKKTLRNRCVLEAACGTGFWTRVVADIAQHVVSTDILNEMLTIAERRLRGFDNAELRLVDAFKEMRGVKG